MLDREQQGFQLVRHPRQVGVVVVPSTTTRTAFIRVSLASSERLPMAVISSPGATVVSVKPRRTVSARWRQFHSPHDALDIEVDRCVRVADIDRLEAVPVSSKNPSAVHVQAVMGQRRARRVRAPASRSVPESETASFPPRFSLLAPPLPVHRRGNPAAIFEDGRSRFRSSAVDGPFIRSRGLWQRCCPSATFPPPRRRQWPKEDPLGHPQHRQYRA